METATNMAIRSVWSENFEEEMYAIYYAMDKYRIVAFDTEFPGVIRNTPRSGLEEERYQDMKYNVDRLKLIQLGLTLCDSNGNVGGVWEFNFGNFDPGSDLQGTGSVQFLTKSGIDFERMKKEGVDHVLFRDRFLELLSSHKGLQWITFHGLYDFAYLMKVVTNRAMPESMSGFVGLLGKLFGRIYDVKFMAQISPSLLNGELGLERLATILKVERVGSAHQAGSDSLLTSLVFTKMRKNYRLAEGLFEGFLYGIRAKIVNQQQQQRPVMVVFPLPQQFYRRPMLNCPPRFYSMPVNMQYVARYPINQYHM